STQGETITVTAAEAGDYQIEATRLDNGQPTETKVTVRVCFVEVALLPDRENCPIGSNNICVNAQNLYRFARFRVLAIPEHLSVIATCSPGYNIEPLALVFHHGETIDVKPKGDTLGMYTVTISPLLGPACERQYHGQCFKMKAIPDNSGWSNTQPNTVDYLWTNAEQNIISACAAKHELRTMPPKAITIKGWENYTVVSWPDPSLFRGRISAIVRSRAWQDGFLDVIGAIGWYDPANKLPFALSAASLKWDGSFGIEGAAIDEVDHVRELFSAHAPKWILLARDTTRIRKEYELSSTRLITTGLPLKVASAITLSGEGGGIDMGFLATALTTMDPTVLIAFPHFLGIHHMQHVELAEVKIIGK
ncbi:hypothetical protein, partial [Thermosphaera sp.]